MLIQLSFLYACLRDGAFYMNTCGRVGGVQRFIRALSQTVFYRILIIIEFTTDVFAL